MDKTNTVLENPRHFYNKAIELLNNQNYQPALSLFLMLIGSEEFGALSYFYSAEISNILGYAKYASECFYKAFEINHR